MKKLTAIILSFALILVLFAFPINLTASAEVATETESTVLFEDDFSEYVSLSSNANRKAALEAKGWEIYSSTNMRAGYTETGAYVNPDQVESYFSTANVEGAAQWSEYSVSAKVTYNSVPETRGNNSYALIVINAYASNEGGYEFGLLNDSDNEKSVIFRRHKSDTLGYTGSNQITKVPFDFDVSGETAYALKAEYKNGIFYGYVDGVLKFTYDTSEDDVMLTEGCAAFRKRGKDCSVTFDDFKVEKTEKNVLFSEDFSNESAAEMRANGWEITDELYSNIVADGSVNFDCNEGKGIYTSFEKSAAWSDYTVEADFTFGENAVTEGLAAITLMGRTNTNNKGYEFGFMINSSGRIQLRVRNTQKTLDPQPDAVILYANDNYPQGETFKLKMVFKGNLIECYCNGVKYFSIEDDGNACGSAGIKPIKPTNGTVNVSVDNFKVSVNGHFFNQTFDSTESAKEYTNTGYAIGTKNGETALTMAEFKSSYLSGDRLAFTADSAQQGFFSPEIDANNYTVEADFRVDGTQTAATTAGILVGAPNAAYASCYYLEVQFNASGEVTGIRIRTVSATSGANHLYFEDNTTKLAVTFANADRPAVNSTVHLTADISYKEDEDKTTINFTCDSESASITLSYKTEGTLPGHAGLFKSAAYGPCSFDNFKAYVNDGYVASLIGDADGDGIVSNADRRMIRNYILGLATTETGDFNKDGNTDILDLVNFKNIMAFYQS